MTRNDDLSEKIIFFFLFKPNLIIFFLERSLCDWGRLPSTKVVTIIEISNPRFSSNRKLLDFFENNFLFSFQSKQDTRSKQTPFESYLWPKYQHSTLRDLEVRHKVSKKLGKTQIPKWSIPPPDFYFFKKHQHEDIAIGPLSDQAGLKRRLKVSVWRKGWKSHFWWKFGFFIFSAQDMVHETDGAY